MTISSMFILLAEKRPSSKTTLRFAGLDATMPG
jgi:hypothetical protein